MAIFPHFSKNGGHVLRIGWFLVAFLRKYETSTSQVYIVDHYTGFSTSWLPSDGVHPNATGANEMSNRWYAVLAPLL